jgi:type IV secretion system protein TrbL
MIWLPSGGVIAGFPNPISWTVDRIAGFIDGAVGAGFEAVVGGLVAWVVDAVVWVIGGVFDFFIDATDPNVQADWFAGPGGPYATTAAIGAVLMVGFVLAGVTQGVLAGDVGGMLRRMAVDLPMSVAGIVGLITVTQVLIRLTDQLSTYVMRSFGEDISDFIAVVVSLSRLGGSVATALVIFLLGLITVLAGLALVAELTVRAALIYIVVALAPLVFAAQLWPALKGVGQKLLRLLCALILSKLAMSVALAVAAAAAVGTGSGGEVTALPEPEVFAEDPGGSVTQAVGILLAASAAFGLAAFMPFFVAKLLPLAEEAAIGQGVRGGPIRSVQQGMSLAYYSRPLHHLASRHRATRPSRPPHKGHGPLPERPALPPGRGNPRALPAGTRPAGALPPGPRPMPAGPTGGGASGAAAGGGSGGAAAGAAGTGGTAGAGASAGGGAAAVGLGAAAGPVGVAAAAGIAAGKTAKSAIDRGVATAGRSAESQVRPVANRPVGGAPAGARPVANGEDPVPAPWGSRPAKPSSGSRGGAGGRGSRS